MLLLRCFNQGIGGITGSFPVCFDRGKAAGYTLPNLPSKPQGFSEDKPLSCFSLCFES